MMINLLFLAPLCCIALCISHRFHRGILGGIVLLKLLLFASAKNVGVVGSGAGIVSLLNANGHIATSFGSVLPTASQYSTINVLILLRMDGDSNTIAFVQGGGLVITEYSASTWAVTSGLITATAGTCGFIGTGTLITITSLGISAGLATGVSNPFSDAGSTEFFCAFSSLGAAVNILGTRNGGLPAIFAQTTSSGATLALPYDWSDGGFDSVNNSPSEQMLLNAVNYVPIDAPSYQPTWKPTSQPSRQPSSQPSRQPSSQPSRQPSNQPSRQPSRQPSNQPSRQPTAQPSTKPSSQPSEQPSSKPSGPPSTKPTGAPSNQPTSRPSSQPVLQPSCKPSAQPSIQPSNHPSLQPSSHPSHQPLSQPSGQPSVSPSMQPSNQPSIQPTSKPTTQPSSQPTTQSFSKPTTQPTTQPSNQPSNRPSNQPTTQPSDKPSSQPSHEPSSQPSSQPSNQPSSEPSFKPTRQPSSQPSGQPSSEPSTQPSYQPSTQPTTRPTIQPTIQPSAQPSSKPSNQPSTQPTSQPTIQPSNEPSTQPSIQPSVHPSVQPSEKPSSQPTVQPSREPSTQPSSHPSTQPSSQPSVFPTAQPSSKPTVQPSTQPWGEPSTQPTQQPSRNPSSQPTNRPSTQPSRTPSSQPTGQPSEQPSNQPSGEPTSQPTEQPFAQPSLQPSAQPSCIPTDQPSGMPSSQPTEQPSRQPSAAPTCQPTKQPSMQPSSQPSIEPSSIPSNQPYSLPTSLPSQQPSSRPTNQPSSIPSHVPTSQPSQHPTFIYRAPGVLSATLNITGSAVSVIWYLDGNSKFAGVLFSACLPGIGSSINASISMIKAQSVMVQYQSYQRFVNVIHYGIKPFSSYTLYAYIETYAGYVNSLQEIETWKLPLQTACCRTIEFSTSPSFVHADARKYAGSLSADSPFIFRYVVSSAPTENVIVTPVLLFSNGSKVPMSVAEPQPSFNRFTASSATPVVASFVLNIYNLDFSGSIWVTLNITGISKLEYISNAVKVEVVGNEGIPPAPSLSNVIFGDSGKDLYILFDSSTDLGGKVFREKWYCSEMMEFVESASVLCTWLNLTAIVGVFPAKSSSAMLSIGGNVTLLAGKIRPYCKTGVCDGYNSTESQFAMIKTAVNAVQPSVILLAPSRIGSCDNITVNAMASTGHGGRDWMSAEWTMYALNGDGAAASASIISTLNSYGTKLGQILTIPRSYFRAGKITLSLTLTNFFGKESTGSVTFTVYDDPLIPKVYIAGPPLLSMRASATFTAYSSVSLASCSNSVSNPVKTVYSWKTYLENSTSDISWVSWLKSSSRLAAKYALPAFSFSAGSVYKVVLNVSVIDYNSSQLLSYSEAEQRVFVIRGDVHARISGGDIRQFLTTRNYVLSSSSSYDEDSPTSRLSYRWSCATISLASYGVDCVQIFSNGSLGNLTFPTVSIFGSMLNTSLTYLVTVTVGTADGRTATKSVTVIGVSQAVTINTDGVANNVQMATEIVTQEVLFNYNSNFSVLSLVQSSEDTNVRWEVFIDGRYQNISVNSPLTRYLSASYAKNTIAMALVMQAFTFVPGSVVSFRIYAESLVSYTPSFNTTGRRHLQSTDTSFISYSEIYVTINGPPSDGQILCSPNSGTAISTVFDVSTSEWVDINPADLPFRFIFEYSVAPLFQPFLTMQSLSTVSTVSSLLPAGLQSYNYVLTLQVTAYDIHSAASAPADTNITVQLGPEVSLTNFSSYLISNVESALNTGSIGQVFQVLGNVASVLNIVNCTAATSDYCTKFNRYPCVNTANTCGKCLSGFVGIVGDANTQCFNSSSNTAGQLGQECVSGLDCLYGSCSVTDVLSGNFTSSSGTCTLPLLQCPSASSDRICSGHGTCEYSDLSGRQQEPTDCVITNANCLVTCHCESNFGGRDCSLNREEVIQRSSLRAQLCQGISTVNNLADESPSLLSSLSSVLLSSYSPYEVLVSEDDASCTSALQSVSQIVLNGHLKDAPISVIENLVGAVSSFVDSEVNVTTERVSTLQSSLSNIASGVADSLSAGHYPLEVVSDNVRLVVLREFITDLLNISLSVPQTEAERLYGNKATTLQFDGGADVDMCSDGSGYVKFSAAGYGRNPFPNATRIESPMLRLSSTTNKNQLPTSDLSSLAVKRKEASSSSSKTLRSLLQSQTLASTTNNAAYYFTVQFMAEQDFQYNLTQHNIDFPDQKSNLTFPECKIYDLDSGSFISCDGCAPLSYTNFNVTFICTDISKICSGGAESSISRYLTDEDGDMSSSLFRESNMRSIGRSLQSGDDDSSATTGGSISVQQYGAIVAAAAAAFVSVLSQNPFNVSIEEAKVILAFVGSLIVFFSTIGVYLYRLDKIENKQSLLQKKWPPDVSHADVWRDFLKNCCCCLGFAQSEENQAQDDRGSTYLSFGSPVQSSTKNDSNSILDSIIPHIFQQKQSALSLFNAVIRNHAYFWMFFQPSYSASRFLRWVEFVKSILLALFIDTLFFQVFYGNDGTCELLVTRLDCLTPQNAATGNAKCIWDAADIDTGLCSLRPPPSNFTFQIMLALLTMMITIPIDIGLSFIVDLYCNKTPDWSKWSYDENRLQYHESRRAEKEYMDKRQSYASALNALLVQEAVNSGATSTRNQFASVEEELVLLKAQLLEHFADCSRVGDERFMAPEELEAWREVKLSRAELITKYFRITEHGTLKYHNKFGMDTILKYFGLQNDNDATAISTNNWDPVLMKRMSTVIVEEAALNHTIRFLTIGKKIKNSGKRKKKFGDEPAPVDSTVALRDMILLHTFVLEQLSMFQKWVLISKLGCFDDYSSPHVHPLKWIGGWMLVTVSCLFFLYWIFAWGIQDGDAMLPPWSINYGLGVIQDILFVNIVKTLLFYFLSRQIILPQLICIHAYLKKIATVEMENRHLPIRKQVKSAKMRFKVIQAISPAVRVAVSMIRTAEAAAAAKASSRALEAEDRRSTLLKVKSMHTADFFNAKFSTVKVTIGKISRLLAQLDDYDILHCKVRTTKRYGYAGWVIVFVPILLSLFGERSADLALDMIMPTFSSAFLLCNYLLQQYGYLMLAVPYIIICGLLCWRFGVFKVFRNRIRAIDIEEAAKRLPVHRNNDLVIPRFKSRSIIADKGTTVTVDTHYTLGFMYFLEPRFLYRIIDYFYSETRRKRLDLERQIMSSCWRRWNSPYNLSPVVMHDPHKPGHHVSVIFQMSMSFEDERRQFSAVSFDGQQSSYPSVHNSFHDNRNNSDLPPEIMKIMAGSVIHSIVSMGQHLREVHRNTAPQQKQEKNIRQLEKSLFQVRRKDALDRWVEAYNNSAHKDNHNTIHPNSKDSKKSRFREYTKQYDVTTQYSESLIRCVEVYLVLQCATSAVDKTISKVVTPKKYRKFAKKLIWTVQKQERDSRTDKGGSSPYALDLYLLVFALRYLFAHTPLPGQAMHPCRPYGRSLSQAIIEDMIRNLLAWLSTLQYVPENLSGTPVVVDLQVFISWFEVAFHWYGGRFAQKYDEEDAERLLRKYLPLVSLPIKTQKQTTNASHFLFLTDNPLDDIPIAFAAPTLSAPVPSPILNEVSFYTAGAQRHIISGNSEDNSSREETKTSFRARDNNATLPVEDANIVVSTWNALFRW